MLILSRVCAEFHDSGGRLLLAVRPENLLSFIEAPEEIQADPLFALLQRDGSLEAVRSVSQRRQLENNPLADTAADGKKVTASVPEQDRAGEPLEKASDSEKTPAAEKPQQPSERKPASRKKSSSADEPASAAP